MPGHGGSGAAAFDDEVMAFWFTSYRLIDGGLKCLIAFGGAERFAQIGCIILTQAHVQRARTGQPHTIAAFAKRAAASSDWGINQWRKATCCKAAR